MQQYCERCVHDDYENEDYCEILMRTMAFDIGDEHYPGDTWVHFNGEPTCLAFREKGGDGEPDDHCVSPDPDQMDLFEDIPILA